MKQLIDFFVIALLLSITFSCNDDSLLDQKPILSNQLSMTEKKDTVQTFGYCYGCLPSISVYENLNQFTIEWYWYNADPINHPVTISYKIDGKSGSENIRSSSGSIQEYVSSDSYIATWSVRCGGYNCSPCKESGSFFKSASGETEFGSVTDCHKEYLSYSVEKVSNQSNMFDLVLEDNNGNLSDTERYMGIDEMRTYLVDSYSGYEYENYSGGLDMMSSPYRIRFYLSEGDMNKRYRVKFFSSKCEVNSEHYLYMNYYFDGFGAQLSDSSLRLIKNH